MMTPPPPFPFHPGFAPMPPRQCPPPPPRHPDLWGDADGYTRKEIDDADARTLASAKGYADGTKVGKADLFDNPDTTPMVKSALLPSYVDDVLEYASTSGFPSSGETGKIYVAKDTNKTYRWTGTQYVQVGGDEQAQADWTQTDSGAPDFIKNKPTIPAAQVQANWNETDTRSKAFIQNKPTIPTVPTNVSAFTNDAGYLTQHQSLSAYRTATAQDAIDGAQDAAIAAKYTKPASGIPASDIASGVIPSVPSASSATPQMDGAGAAGTATTYARGDHEHPSDTAKVNKSGDTMTGGLVVSAAGFEERIGPIGMSVGAGSDSVSVLADRIVRAKNGASAGIYVPKPDTNLCTLALQEGIAPAFSSASTYAVGDYCTHEGLLYKCTTAVSTAGAWNASDWTAVAVTDEMGGGGGNLPYDAEVEYIELDYDSYFDTGISADTIDSAYGFFRTRKAGQRFYFGARNSTNSGNLAFAFISGYGARWSYGTVVDNKITNIQTTDWHIAGFNGARAFYDGHFLNYTQTGTPASLNTFLGTVNNDGSPILQSDNVSLCIRSFSIVTASGIIRDFTAVRKNGVGCLYDRISGTFFYNAGTGNCYVGPDISPQVPTDSPAFTGTPTAPTATAGTNTTQIATTAFVQSAIAALRSELGLT